MFDKVTAEYAATIAKPIGEAGTGGVEQDLRTAGGGAAEKNQPATDTLTLAGLRIGYGVMSPAMAAAAAITGHLTDVREMM